MKEKILSKLAEKGSLAQGDVVEYLLSKADPEQYLEFVYGKLKEAPVVLTMDILRDYEHSLDVFEKNGAAVQDNAIATNVDAGSLEPASNGLGSAPSIATATLPTVSEGVETALPQSATARLPSRKQISLPLDLRVADMKLDCNSNIDGFCRYFRDRFTRLKKIIKRRPEMMGAVPAERLCEGEVTLIGMVQDIRPTTKGHKIVIIEDETGTVTAMILNGSPLLADPLIIDEVIGVKGRMGNGYLILERITRPDVPVTKTVKHADAQVEAAFISDIHIGSNTFLNEAWARFMDWMTTEDAERIGYIVVSGDMVDGVGVYPNQDIDLVIDNVFEQYRMLVNELERLPTHIKLIMLPGNHDIVRQAEPQPALPTAVQTLFSELGCEVLFCPNPCTISLNGVNVLCYHGRSADDLIQRIPALSYNRPIDMMKEMLKRRHLAPIYGGKTPLTPMTKDHLVIEEPPDIFVTGHVHTTAVHQYRNIILINASCWQSQTSYQRTLGFEPDPAKVAVVDLQSMQVRLMEFT